MADAEAKEPPCAFSISSDAKHTYRAWHSWDLSGTVTMGEAAMSFAIEDMAPAMVVEPEPRGRSLRIGQGGLLTESQGSFRQTVARSCRFWSCSRYGPLPHSGGGPDF